MGKFCSVTQIIKILRNPAILKKKNYKSYQKPLWEVLADFLVNCRTAKKINEDIVVSNSRKH